MTTYDIRWRQDKNPLHGVSGERLAQLDALEIRYGAERPFLARGDGVWQCRIAVRAETFDDAKSKILAIAPDALWGVEHKLAKTMTQSRQICSEAVEDLVRYGDHGIGFEDVERWEVLPE